MQKHFAVAIGEEANAFGFQFPAKFRVVVDFAIRDENVFAIRRDHWLMPGLAEVIDRQTSMSKPHRTAKPYAFVIRSPVM